MDGASQKLGLHNYLFNTHNNQVNMMLIYLLRKDETELQHLYPPVLDHTISNQTS